MNSLVCIFLSLLVGTPIDKAHDLAFPQISLGSGWGGEGKGSLACWWNHSVLNFNYNIFIFQNSFCFARSLFCLFFLKYLISSIITFSQTDFVITDNGNSQCHLRSDFSLLFFGHPPWCLGCFCLWVLIIGLNSMLLNHGNFLRLHLKVGSSRGHYFYLCHVIGVN